MIGVSPNQSVSPDFGSAMLPASKMAAADSVCARPATARTSATPIKPAWEKHRKSRNRRCTQAARAAAGLHEGLRIAALHDSTGSVNAVSPVETSTLGPHEVSDYRHRQVLQAHRSKHVLQGCANRTKAQSQQACVPSKAQILACLAFGVGVDSAPDSIR